MRRLAVALLAAALAVSACAVANAPFALDDSYDVAVGQLAVLRVLANDYVPAERDLELLDPPAWAEVDGETVTAAVPPDFEYATFDYRVTADDEVASASIELRGVHVRARLEPVRPAVAAGDRHQVAAVVERRVADGPWTPLSGASVTAVIATDTAGARWDGAPTCSTDSDGSCPVALRAGEPGRATLALAAIETGGVAITPDGVQTQTVAWVDARVRMSGDATELVGRPSTVAATLEVHDGTEWTPAPAGTIEMQRSAGSLAVPRLRCDIASDAACELRLVADAPQSVHLAAAAEVTVEGVSLSAVLDGRTSPMGSVAWAQAIVELSPDTDAVAGGRPASVIVSVRAHDGATEAAAADAQVSFELIADPDSQRPDAEFVGQSGCETGPAGTCSVELAASNAGRVHLAAKTVVIIDGLEVPAEADGLMTDRGSVTWLAPSLRLQPPSRALVGERVTVSASVVVDDGIEPTLRRGPKVAFTITSAGNGASLVGGRRCNAPCAATLRADEPGRAVVSASATVRIAGEHAAVADSTTVTWDRVSVILTGGGVAEAGEPISFTAAARRGEAASPAPGVQVTFAPTLGALEPCTTGADGACTTTASSTDPATGEVTIAAARLDGREIPASGTATARWVQAWIEIPAATVSVGTFPVAATVWGHDGDHQFRIADDTPLTVEGFGTCRTGEDGSCEVMVAHNSGGPLAVEASAPVRIHGVEVEARGTSTVTVLQGVLTLHVLPPPPGRLHFGYFYGEAQELRADLSSVGGPGPGSGVEIKLSRSDSDVLVVGRTDAAGGFTFPVAANTREVTFTAAAAWDTDAVEVSARNSVTLSWIPLPEETIPTTTTLDVEP